MRTYFKGKTIVISGIARGIGKALAMQAAEMECMWRAWMSNKKNLMILSKN